MSGRDLKVNPPNVGTMVPVCRRHARGRELAAAEQATLREVANDTALDKETRMLASILAVMSPGQRKLLTAKLKS